MPKFEEKNGIKVTQEFAIDSVSPQRRWRLAAIRRLSSVAVLQAEANSLHRRACRITTDICTNYGNHRYAKERAGPAENWFPLRVDRGALFITPRKEQAGHTRTR
jgi:hypothetical protein